MGLRLVAQIKPRTKALRLMDFIRVKLNLVKKIYCKCTKNLNILTDHWFVCTPVSHQCMK